MRRVLKRSPAIASIAVVQSAQILGMHYPKTYSLHIPSWFALYKANLYGLHLDSGIGSISCMSLAVRGPDRRMSSSPSGQRGLKRAPSGRSPGLDGTPVELYRRFQASFIPVLRRQGRSAIAFSSCGGRGGFIGLLPYSRYTHTNTHTHTPRTRIWQEVGLKEH